MKAVLAVIVIIVLAVIITIPFADEIFDSFITQFDLKEDEDQ